MIQQKGFTLVEVLLSVSIMSLLIGLSWPVYHSFLARNDLDLTAESTAHALRRAQTYARGMYYDSAWSVHISSTAVTVFLGTNYASRDTAYDEVIAVPATLSANTTLDVSFSKLSATPSTTGSITFTSDANETRTVSLNEKGMVTY